MFAVCIAFVCFYHAERVLSAIAKFLAYHFGQREGRGEIWDRGKIGEESGREWGGYEGAENGNTRSAATDLTFGDAPCGLPPLSYILHSSFTSNICLAEIMPLSCTV